MRVILRFPEADEREISGPHTVGDLLVLLDLNPEAVLVLSKGQLLTRDARLGEDDEVEIRPVVSGGGISAMHPLR